MWYCRLMNMKAFDVVVVGAGISGVSAAVRAARLGAKVALVEMRDATGGMMKASLGMPVCGLYVGNNQEKPVLLNEGLSLELHDAVLARDAGAVVKMGREWVLNCSSGLFDQVVQGWLDALPGLSVFTECKIVEAQVENARLVGVSGEVAPGVSQVFHAKAFVDCSGVAAVVQASGASIIVPGRDVPLSGYAVEISPVTEDSLLEVRIAYCLRAHVEKGELPSCIQFSSFSRDCDDSATGRLKLCVSDEIKPGDIDLIAGCVVDILRSEIDALRTSVAIRSSPCILHREGVRGRGKVVLRQEDVLSGKRVDGAAARGGWPIEFWSAGAGPVYRYIAGGIYDIPFGVLESDDMHGLWLAGRTVSADSQALASVRVMGTCVGTGEAAGLAAARVADEYR